MDTTTDACETLEAPAADTSDSITVAPSEWQDIFQVRLQNLDVLVEEAGSAAELARRSQSDPSYISQIRTRATYGRGVTRRVGEKFARRLEEAMGKPRGWMDALRSGDGRPVTEPKTSPQRSDARIADFVPGVYRHYKGQHYLAHGLARADETNEVVVVYTRLYARDGLPMSTRLLSLWLQDVEWNGAWVPRFTLVGHETP